MISNTFHFHSEKGCSNHSISPFAPSSITSIHIPSLQLTHFCLAIFEVAGCQLQHAAEFILLASLSQASSTGRFWNRINAFGELNSDDAFYTSFIYISFWTSNAVWLPEIFWFRNVVRTWIQNTTEGETERENGREAIQQEEKTKIWKNQKKIKKTGKQQQKKNRKNLLTSQKLMSFKLLFHFAHI